MQLIHIDVDTMRQARISANFDSYMRSMETFMNEGFVVQIVQEYNNAPTDNLFQFRTFEEFEEWVNNGCLV